MRQQKGVYVLQVPEWISVEEKEMMKETVRKLGFLVGTTISLPGDCYELKYVGPSGRGRRSRVTEMRMIRAARRRR